MVVGCLSAVVEIQVEHPPPTAQATPLKVWRRPRQVPILAAETTRRMPHPLSVFFAIDKPFRPHRRECRADSGGRVVDIVARVGASPSSAMLLLLLHPHSKVFHTTRVVPTMDIVVQ